MLVKKNKFYAIFLVILISGCQSGSKLIKSGSSPQFVNVSSISKKPLFPVTFKVNLTNRLFSNYQFISETLSSKLLDTSIYKGTYQKITTKPTINVELTIKDESPSFSSMVLNGSKVIVNVGSLFLFSSILPFNRDFDSNYRLKVTWPDGSESKYDSDCVVNLTWVASWTDSKDYIKESNELLAQSCINSVVNQMSVGYLAFINRYQPIKAETENVNLPNKTPDSKSSLESGVFITQPLLIQKNTITSEKELIPNPTTGKLE